MPAPQDAHAEGYLAIEGHRIRLQPIKKWVIASCACGWASAAHPGEDKAIAAAIRHLEIRGRHAV